MRGDLYLWQQGLRLRIGESFPVRRVHTPRTSSSVALQEMRVNLRAEAGRLGTGAPRAAGAQQPPPGTAKSTTVSHLFGFPIYCLFFPAGFFFSYLSLLAFAAPLDTPKPCLLDFRKESISNVPSGHFL